MKRVNIKSGLILGLLTLGLMTGCASQTQQDEISQLRADLRSAERAAESAENCERQVEELRQRAEQAEDRAEELERRMQRMEERMQGSKT
ncbi:hypothetical protein CWE09_10185 [Aliidiomarina minuta]|uniref:Uncharacterized protein n=1 Tax=Aliidiomarina minuta TaxID=880057 RepID=A0A432WA48_9GAMM|nr:hypothetical protein [Aliidiomarina minuta]RUO27037.1 hypothetical protein CWE09_10185 [Aliidiomarina minuta]